jgi:release factor glutamine methyltransferase
MLTLDVHNDHWRGDPASAGAAIAHAVQLLRAAGLEEGARDARLLTAAALNVDPAALVKHPEIRLTPIELERLQSYIRRRIEREPVSRILGRRGFYGRDFAISPATLDPRPDSETLIEAALQLVAESGWNDAPIRILDIGTGSGCLLVTLLAELPAAVGVGSDIDVGALQIAKENAECLGVAARARFVESRSLATIDGAFDLLISNPPYIPTAEIASLDPDVRRYDPLTALDGGIDGLDIYREITRDLVRVVPDGWALFEVGAGQADAVTTLLQGAEVGSMMRRFCDLDGRDRCVAWKARRSGPYTKPLGIRLGTE